MKEDYLWDKTGADPAIEKLENALSVFRFDESSLQMPVAARVPVERPRYFKFLSFGFAAAAACLVVGVISWALLGRAFNPDKTIAQEDQVLTLPADPTLQGPPAVGRPDLPVTVAVKAPARKIGHNNKAARKPVRPAAVTTARANKPASAAAPFTKEEIYAYNRLMLALSITSDKLNLVKEKIPGE